MVFRSAWDTFAVRLRRLRRLPLFMDMRWPLEAWWRRILPLAVTFTRLSNPLCGLSLGMVLDPFQKIADASVAVHL